MFATRRSRALALLGLVALAGLLVARARRRTAAASPARPARAPDGVASEPVTDDVHDRETQDVTELDVADHDDVVQEAVEIDDVDDEPMMTARVYEASEPPVVDEPAEPADVTEPADAAEPEPEPVAAEPGPEPEPAAPTIDLDRIERDLEGVEAALRRLDEGTYWTDEITGEPLDEALLVADPVARRNVA